jgi:hypothetical protein
MYYRINDQPQNDSDNTTQNIYPEPPKIINLSPRLKVASPSNGKFPLWLLISILFGLGLVGILMFLQIKRKYSFTTGKKSNFGIFK